jgi:hypothetical protein
VDDLGLSFQSTHFVRRALKQFVDQQIQAGDLVAIIRTSGGMGALQQHGLTVGRLQDRALVLLNTPLVPQQCLSAIS